MSELLKQINETHKDKCPRHCVVTKDIKCEDCLSYEYCVCECLVLLEGMCRDQESCKSVIQLESKCRFIV